MHYVLQLRCFLVSEPKSSLLIPLSAVCKRLSNTLPILYVDMCRCSCAHSNTLSLCLQQVRTGDLGGYASSDEFTRAVIANMAV